MAKVPPLLKLLRVVFQLVNGIKLFRPIVRRLWPPMRLEVCGQVMLLHPSDNSTERFMWRRGTRREAASIGRLTLLVAARQALIVDIGANCGAYTLPLTEAASAESKTLAFEPNPAMTARLRQNLELNNLQDRVEVHQVALGAENGSAALWLGDRNLGASSLRSPPLSSSRSITVPVKTLTSFIPQSMDDFEIFVIKCDIEGFEDQALAPFLDSAPETSLPDAILMETTSSHLWEVDLVRLLAQRGYQSFFEGEDQNTLFLKGPCLPQQFVKPDSDTR